MSKLETSIDFKDSQPANKLNIFVTSDVIKLFKFIDVIFLHPANIRLILVSFSEYISDKSTSVILAKPLNIDEPFVIG